MKRAAEEHAVPRSTLQYRMLRNLVHETKPGAKQYYLNQAEEEELSEYIVTAGKIGFGKIHIAEKVAVENDNQFHEETSCHCRKGIVLLRHV